MNFTKIVLVSLVLLSSTALWASPKIDKANAITIAAGAVDLDEVGPITDVSLEEEDGLLLYAVEFAKDGVETDVKIDAQTGEIIKIESDLTETEEEAETE